jgi:hypothetical protein
MRNGQFINEAITIDNGSLILAFGFHRRSDGSKMTGFRLAMGFILVIIENGSRLDSIVITASVVILGESFFSGHTDDSPTGTVPSHSFAKCSSVTFEVGSRLERIDEWAFE